MTRRGRVRAATDQATGKRRNPLAFFDAVARPSPVTRTIQNRVPFWALFCIITATVTGLEEERK